MFDTPDLDELTLIFFKQADFLIFSIRAVFRQIFVIHQNCGITAVEEYSWAV